MKARVRCVFAAPHLVSSDTRIKDSNSIQRSKLFIVCSPPRHHFLRPWERNDGTGVEDDSRTVDSAGAASRNSKSIEQDMTSAIWGGLQALPMRPGLERRGWISRAAAFHLCARRRLAHAGRPHCCVKVVALHARAAWLMIPERTMLAQTR